MKKKWRSGEEVVKKQCWNRSEKDGAVSRRVGEQEMNWQKDSHAAKDQDRHRSRLQQRHRLMVCTWSVHKTKSSHKLIIWEFINLKRRRGIMGLQADATRRSPDQRNRPNRPTNRSSCIRIGRQEALMLLMMMMMIKTGRDSQSAGSSSRDRRAKLGGFPRSEACAIKRF